MKHVTIHTDGACSGNPGPGGWGALLQSGPHAREIKGGAPDTTNNRMELTAVIEALRALRAPCRVALYTDSTYVKNGITKWLAAWRANNWRTKDRKPVRNEDLWRILDGLRERHEIVWHHVKGHAGHAENERADALARAGMQPFLKRQAAG